MALFVLFVGLGVFRGYSQAAPVELQFDRLPSEQGWRFFANYKESQVVSLDQSVLAFDTRKGSTPVAGGYRRDGLFETNSPSYVVSLRARVIAAANPGRISSHFEITAVPPGGVVSFLHLDGDNVLLETTVGPSAREDRFIEVDTSRFHDYRIEAIRGVGACLFVDDILAASSATTYINREIDNDLSFGVQRHRYMDPNIVAEVTRMESWNSSRSAEIPIVSCIAPAEGACGVPAVVGANVTDPNGDAMELVWSVNGIPVAVDTLPASHPLAMHRLDRVLELPVGDNVVSVEANDGISRVVSSERRVLVRDTAAPVILAAEASKPVLWPPSNQLVPVSIDAAAIDDCSETTFHIQEVSCNEPLQPADLQFHDNHTVSLRATRSGRGSGRIYTLWIQAADAAGNLSNLFPVTVTVPHNYRGK